MKFLLSFCLSVACLSVHSSQAQVIPSAQVEEIVVVAKRPGPQLWQVNNGENTLWIFGVVSLLPESFEWDSKSAEFLIANSQSYLKSPSSRLTLGYNPFRYIGAFRGYNKAKKNPDGKELKDVIDEDLYQEFLIAKQKYAPKDKKIERFTPFSAANRIYNAALKSEKLKRSGKIVKEVNKIAKKAKVEIIDSSNKERAKVKSLLQDLKNISLHDQTQCLVSTLKSLETDINLVRKRANIWADGDAKALVRDGFSKPLRTCFEQILVNEQVERLYNDSRDKWLSAARLALKEDKSTFTILPLEQITEKDGLISRLLEGGYTFVGPRQGDL